MEKSLFNKEGNAIAYITDDYHGTIYLWDGSPVAHLFEDRQIYGMNGRHLGWFINDILYDNDGNRIGFTSGSCPVAVEKEPIKPEKYPKDEIRPRWSAPPLPNLSFGFSDTGLADLLKEGRITRYNETESAEEQEED